LVFYLKDDFETGVNSLFVLSQSEDILESLMTRLNISKKDLIFIMRKLLHQNLEEVSSVKQALQIKGSTQNSGEKAPPMLLNQ